MWGECLQHDKQDISSHTAYLFMFQNGLAWKDAIFVIVPLYIGKIVFTSSYVTVTPKQIISCVGGMSFSGDVYLRPLNDLIIRA